MSQPMFVISSKHPRNLLNLIRLFHLQRVASTWTWTLWCSWESCQNSKAVSPIKTLHSYQRGRLLHVCLFKHLYRNDWSALSRGDEPAVTTTDQTFTFLSVKHLQESKLECFLSWSGSMDRCDSGTRREK